MNIPDMCGFIDNICKDPYKMITGLTIGNFEALQAHTKLCMTCGQKIDEVLAREKPRDTSLDPSLN